MRQENKIVYVARNGREFSSEFDCVKYELQGHCRITGLSAAWVDTMTIREMVQRLRDDLPLTPAVKEFLPQAEVCLRKLGLL